MIYDYVYIIWLIASDVYTRTFNATCAVSRLTAGKCKLLGAWLAPWPRPKGRAGWRGSQHQGVFKRQRLAQAFGARWLPASLTWRSGELTWDSPVKKWPRLCHLGGQPKIWPVLRAREVSLPGSSRPLIGWVLWLFCQPRHGAREWPLPCLWLWGFQVSGSKSPGRSQWIDSCWPMAIADAGNNDGEPIPGALGGRSGRESPQHSSTGEEGGGAHWQWVGRSPAWWGRPWWRRNGGG